MQQHHRRTVAAVADTQRYLSNVDKLDVEAVKEAHANAFPEIPPHRTRAP